MEVSKSDSGAPNGYEFGNINNNDWYVFTGLTISFTFGRSALLL